MYAITTIYMENQHFCLHTKSGAWVRFPAEAYNSLLGLNVTAPHSAWRVCADCIKHPSRVSRAIQSSRACCLLWYTIMSPG